MYPSILERGTVHPETEIVGALPVINHFLYRLRIPQTMCGYMLDGRHSLAPAKCPLVLLINVAEGRKPVYELRKSASSFVCSLLGLDEGDQNIPHA